MAAKYNHDEVLSEVFDEATKTIKVSGQSAALPANASTATAQTAGNDLLTSINNKTPVRVDTEQTLINGAVAVGDGTPLDVEGKDFVAVDIRGMDAASITFKGSYNGTDYDDLYGLREGTFTFVSNTPDNGLYIVKVEGMKWFKPRVATYVSSLPGGIIVKAKRGIGNPYQIVFNYQMNVPTPEDRTNGVFYTMQKKFQNATLGALFSSGIGDADGVVIAKSSPGNIYAFYGSNNLGVNAFFQIHNRTSISANDVPLLSFPVADKGLVSRGEELFGEQGLFMNTGISTCWSSAIEKYTAIGGIDATKHASGVSYL